ncbi:MAG: DUF6457 domain-containing protein [Candidatus Nanopelagicales bacterium]|jgi:hypothetical protein
MSHDQLSQWTAATRHALATDLGVDIPDVDAQTLLDVARDAAHAVDRPAAPITTYLLGYAAALSATPDALATGATTLQRLSAEWDLGLHRE